MFNAKTAAAPKINAFVQAVRKATKLKVTPVFRAASGLRFEITINSRAGVRDVVVVDVNRDTMQMRVTGITLDHGEVETVGSHVVKSFPQFARVVHREYGIELVAV